MQSISSESCIASLKSFKKICVTGATGWLGRELVELVSQVLGDDFNRRVTLVGSNRSILQINEMVYPVISWGEFVDHSDFDLIIHLAYLNQDKCASLGVSKFIETNRLLTEDTLRVAARSSSSVLLASSGAVKHYSPLISSLNPYEIYAGLKLETENMFAFESRIENLLIMRIWNVSGKHMLGSNSYALSSFIQQARSRGRIEIRGNSHSTRTYINASEMFQVYLSVGRSFNRSPVDSGGFEISLRDLAICVAKLEGLNMSSVIETGNDLLPSHYNPDRKFFDEIRLKSKIELSDIEMQVKFIMNL